MYVNFYDHNFNQEETNFPSIDDSAKPTKYVGHSHMIHFSKREISNRCENIDECIAIISIQGLDSVEYNDFYVVAYTEMPRLVSNTVMIGKVSEETMVYYTYTSYCDSWSLIISTSTYSINADLGLYINVGSDKELPTIEKHDIESTVWFSEVEHIHSEHEYFKDNNTKSMKQVFLIGVLSKQVQTFLSKLKKLIK